MCTAASYLANKNELYFGRTLDYDCSFGESVCFVPRNFPFKFTHEGECREHYAMIGMAHIASNYPLFYDCANEHGLAMAGLNFVGNAFYREKTDGKTNVATFEFIPFLLGQCKDLSEARKMLAKINLTSDAFSEKLPPAELHWIICDKTGTIVVESTREGIFVYDDPAGVLTNNPVFPQQISHLANYINVSPKEPENRFAPGLSIKPYSRGMGALGLPGDLSSGSRFVRAAFARNNSVVQRGDDPVSQFFHILGFVEQPRGCCELSEGKYEITIYTSCIDCERGVYYYTTYENHGISAVDMRREDLDGFELKTFRLAEGERINYKN